MHYLILAIVMIVAVLTIFWRVTIWMPGQTFRGEPSPLDEGQQRMQQTLQNDLQTLANVIGERNVSHCFEQLAAAAEFLETELRDAGYETRRHEFPVDGKTVCNIEAECRGTSSAEIVVVGAHYDTVPDSPGANDNGSAVVANLALARAVAQRRPKRTVRFVFFVNEESPYYMTDAMGSLRHAQRCRENRENLVGMISLETIGCHLNEAGTQRYPIKLLEYLYPTTGNFVAFVGNIRSRRFVRQAIRGFRQGEFPSEGLAAPRWLKDIFRSDHAAFWHCGYPALMVTDTANFRYRHYHTPEDTYDKINYSALTRIVSAMERCLLALAEL
jgi:hypothetical protein